ncbi:MAG: hypothetical protein RLZZ67_135 [Candidatus Parcubacteria bacterium]|jgi:hypothetical protein
MKIIRAILKWCVRFIGLLIIGYGILILLTTPKTNRDWNTDQAVDPRISINDNLVTIQNIRNFTYRTTSDYTPGYYDKTFNLDTISSVDFMVEPFSTNPGAAHTLLTFGFSDGGHVAISVEIRKEKGENFSATKGFLRQYELAYVIADEHDVIGLRANYRRDQVFLYPIKADKAGMKSLFLDMLARADKLQQKPEFYNTLTSTCTTNIVSHVNKLVPDRIPYDLRILLPGYSDRYAYELGLINTDLPFEEARTRFNINARAEKYADSPQFSKMIRD